ncbi:sulfatase family protein [Methylohalobius crimeensis]|uniref:sulfatase family protein n=1 Tax=Methylohalobius crimeensis TaxID=244365 RepID=UPI00040E96F2|nr:sulfatase-like hydrolase/transferase [Methylohalobius crimeensis]
MNQAIIKALIADGLLGLVGASLLLWLSLRNFSRTGPQIREEIASHFRLYTVYCVLRLAFWSFLILFWLAGFGQILYLAWVFSGEGNASYVGFLLAGTGAIGGLTWFQFLRHLLHIPASLMMSFSYDIRRLHPFWKKLTVSRLRWSMLFLVAIYLGLFLYGLGENPSETQGFLAIGLSIWVVPWLLASVPLPARPRPSRQNEAGPPNLLLIGCDTLRADRLLDYSRNAAPFLKALSTRGTLFSHCYTPIARTAPSLATLFTGCAPEFHGIKFNYIGDHQITLPVKAFPEILAEQGYHTEAISDWSGSDLGKFSFGFQKKLMPKDQWNFRYLIRQGPKELRLFLSCFTHNRFGRVFLPELYFLAGVPLTSHLGRIARRRLSALGGKKQPFCLTLYLASCHPPFGSEYPYYRLFADPHYHGASLFAMARLTDPFEIIRSQREPRQAFDLDQVVDLYDGCVRRFDDEVRAVFHHLTQCGLDRNTVVVIFSDHGMELFEHGTWGQGNSAIGEQSNRIPVLIYDPEQKGRGIVDEITRAVDIAPTLLDRCGITPPPTMEGQSLVNLLQGKLPNIDLTACFKTGLWLTRHPAIHPRHLFYPDIVDLLHIPDKSTGTLAIKPEYLGQIERARDIAVCRRQWKLVRLALNDTPRYLLFDMNTDPGCHEDVADHFPEVVEELRTYLKTAQSEKLIIT